MKKAIIDSIIETMTNMTDSKMLDYTSTDLKSFVTATTNTSAFTGLQAIAGSLIAFFFLIHLVQTTMKERSDPDAIFKDLALCCLYAAIVTNLGALVINLADVCSNLINITRGHMDGLKAAFGNAPAVFDVEQFRPEFEKKHWMVLMLDAALYKTFGNLSMIILKIIAKVAIYTVELEIMIRTVLLPLGISQLPDDGWRGAGGRYIKAWIGCAFQLIVISAALDMYPLLCLMAMDSNANSVLVSILAAGFACGGLCMKASSIAREVAGA